MVSVDLARTPRRRRGLLRPSNGAAALTPGAYEVVLRCNGHEELRLTDHLELFAREQQTLEFRGQRWRIAATEPSSQSGFVARLICEPALMAAR